MSQTCSIYHNGGLLWRRRSNCLEQFPASIAIAAASVPFQLARRRRRQRDMIADVNLAVGKLPSLNGDHDDDDDDV